LNSKGKGAGLHFYQLVDLLFAESVCPSWGGIS
jgi:hypothetical protein